MSPVVIGNLRITPKAKTVELRLITDTGTAIFGYGELEQIARTLSGLRYMSIKPVAEDEDLSDLI